MAECHNCAEDFDGAGMLCAKCSVEYANEPSQYEEDNPTYVDWYAKPLALFDEAQP